MTDYTDNIVLFCTVVGLDIVVGMSIIAIIAFADIARRWATLTKLGALIIAAGVFGQAYYLASGLHLSDPAHDQIWILKDIGIAVWTLSVIFQWIDSVFRVNKS